MAAADAGTAWAHLGKILPSVNGEKMLSRMTANSILTRFLDKGREGELPNPAAEALQWLFTPSKKRVLDRLKQDLAEIEKFGGHVGELATRSLRALHSLSQMLNLEDSGSGRRIQPPAREPAPAKTPAEKAPNPKNLRALGR